MEARHHPDADLPRECECARAEPVGRGKMDVGRFKGFYVLFDCARQPRRDPILGPAGNGEARDGYEVPRWLECRRFRGRRVYAHARRFLEQEGDKLVERLVGAVANAIPQALFTGHLEGPELGRAVASADILINPSVTEAFGNVNLEAMASGLAIVSADVDSARSVIRHGQEGLLVPPRQPPAYADAVERLLDPTELRRRLGQNALAASMLHSWKDVLASVVETYRLTGR